MMMEKNDNVIDAAEENSGSESGSGMNAQKKLREILGETEVNAPETDIDRASAGSDADEANADDPAGIAAAPAQGTDAADNSSADVSGPDPSIVNWARDLWRHPGSTYGSGQRTYASLDATASSRKPGAGKVVRTILLTVLCLILGVVAALQFKAISARSNTEPDSEKRINELLGTIYNLHSELDSLEAERKELQNRLDILEQSSQEDQLASLRSELSSVRTFAGLTGVKGKGIHIQLDFTERTNVNSIQNMLLLLINELRASGAQAISINGVRILAMTEIRVVSEQYISVNARQLIAPYDIYAIGDALDLYSGITMGGNGIVYQLKNLAGTTCTWDIQENIVIGPAADEDIKTDLLTPNP